MSIAKGLEMQDKSDTTGGGSSSARSRKGQDTGQASVGSTGPNTFTGAAAGAGRSAGASAGSGGLAEHAKDSLSGAATQAGDKVASRLDSEKNRAAEGLGSVAQALRQTSDSLREQNQGGGFEGYIASAADQVERFSGYLRSTDTRDMVRRVEQFAREQPAVFLGSAFMLGLLAARFLRSSARDTSAQYGATARDQAIPQGAYTGTTPYSASAAGTAGAAPGEYGRASTGATGIRGPEEV
jgi:hypothetical protein